MPGLRHLGAPGDERQTAHGVSAMSSATAPSVRAAPTLAARLIGMVEVQLGGDAVSLAANTPCRHLLARMLLAAGRPVPTPRLACDLWPGLPLDRGVCIQMTINGLRRVFRAQGVDPIVTAGDAYGIARRFDTWVDLCAFRQEVARARCADVDGRFTDAAAAYERAIALARDELLVQEPLATWIDAERRVFRREVLAVRARLTELHDPAWAAALGPEMPTTVARIPSPDVVVT